MSICSFCLISAFPVCTTASFPSPQTELCVSGVVKEMFTSIFVIKKKKITVMCPSRLNGHYVSMLVFFCFCFKGGGWVGLHVSS